MINQFTDVEDVKNQVFSPELEKKVLNTMFHDTEEADWILAHVEQSDFYISKYKSVYSVVKGMRVEKMAITPDTVYNYLLTKDGSGKATLALETMLDFLMTETGIPYKTKETDARLLREMAFQRKVRLLQNPTIQDLKELAELHRAENATEIIDPKNLKKEILNDRNKDEPIYSTGIKRVDGNFKFIRGQLIIISGIPGHGKSEVCDQIIVNTIKNYGFKWLVFSPENYPVQNHIKNKLIPKLIDSNDSKEIQGAIDTLLEFIDFVNPETDARTVDDILAILSPKYDGLLIDPWNELYHNFEQRNMSETRYIEQTLTRIRNEARSRGLCAIVAAHPRKMEKLPVDRGKRFTYYATPKAYDIMGSSNWYNKADAILSVYKPPELFEDRVLPAKNAHLHILKIRERRLGQVGSVPLKYDRETGIIT